MDGLVVERGEELGGEQAKICAREERVGGVSIPAIDMESRLVGTGGEPT